MKINKFLILSICAIGIHSVHAQQKTNLSIKDAVKIVLSKGNEVVLAQTKASTKRFELQSVKNNQYPDFKLSGQYLQLTNANINQKNTTQSTDPNAAPTNSPSVNQLVFGQANLTLPLFSGFKLKNSIKASEQLYKAELANAAFTSEKAVLQVISYYAQLYQLQKSVELLKESLASSQQRVTDFTDLEKNGIIARNDLLKSQLQVAKVQLSLSEAEKNVRVVNYNLITLLKLDSDTQIEVNPDNIEADLFSQLIKTTAEALTVRKDLEALQLATKASEYNIKVAKSNYYPSFSILGGYTALNLQNVVTITNALNLGIGFSYNMSSLFKNTTDVKMAKSRFATMQQQQVILTDHIQSEIVAAKENYTLSMQQNLVYNQAVEQASENYRIVKDKYDNGLSNTNDLLEADVEALTAKINVAYAQANMALKFYELLDATGTLIQSFNLSKN